MKQQPPIKMTKTTVTLGPITYEEMPGKYKYRLDEDEYQFNFGFLMPQTIRHSHFTMYQSGRVKVFPGYCWDGVTWGPDSDETLRASLEHDILCQLYRVYKLGNPFIDDINSLFIRTAREDGMGKVRAWCYLQLLRMFWRVSRRKD
jgi:hypothetical protein